MNISRQQFSLGQKVFIVKEFYKADGHLGVVREHFQKEFKVLAADSIYKIIQNVIEIFETSGSVQQQMFFETATLTKKVPVVIATPTPPADDFPQFNENVYQVLDDNLNGFGIYTQVQAIEEVYTHPPSQEIPLAIASIESGVEDNNNSTILIEDSSDSDQKTVEEESEMSDSKPPLEGPEEVFVEPEVFKEDNKANINNFFACSICPKSFNSNSSLIIHMRIHTGERPYKCSYCDKSFKQKGARTVHHRRHTGENPFPCNMCGKGYKQLINLKCHLKSVHGLEGDSLQAAIQ